MDSGKFDRSVFDSNLITYLSGEHCDFWTINPYTTCDFRCTYCISGAQGASKPTFEKSHALQIISQTLTRIPPGLPLALGGISDAYAHAEMDLEITRDLLKILNEQQRTYNIVTKSTLVERDIDLLLQNPKSTVSFSFSTLDDDAALRFELAAPKPSMRLKTLERLHDAGINVMVSLRPWIPTVTDVQQFLDCIPADIPIGLERLIIMRSSRRFPIGERLYTQREIDDLYLEEQANYTDCTRLNWAMDRRFSPDVAGEEHPFKYFTDRRDVVFQELVEREKLVESEGQASPSVWQRLSRRLLPAREAAEK